jgi:RNA polymerase sigma-70 factor (ECF subfamily)
MILAHRNFFGPPESFVPSRTSFHAQAAGTDAAGRPPADHDVLCANGGTTACSASDYVTGMSVSIAKAPEARESLDRLLAALRPRLHRYCARMTGSVIDGEDVVQEAFMKAIEAVADAGPIANPEGWIFRVAHNAALDLLRRRARHDGARADKDLEMIADPAAAADRHDIASTSLRTFMRLPALPRSSVILMDVLGYSLEEIGTITGSTTAAVKAALHRGRARLRELANEPENLDHPALAASDRVRLTAYVDRFNARDFDTIRDMLAGDVQLELVARARMKGRKEVATYFRNYASVHDWRLVPGFVDRRLALLVYDPRDPAKPPSYFVLLAWSGDSVSAIRDFRHARYAIDGAELFVPVTVSTGTPSFWARQRL